MSGKGLRERDRFRIMCEADASDMGVLLAHMTRMGITNIGFELVTEVRRFASNSAPKRFAVTSEQAIRAYIANNPTFAVADLVQSFRSEGRTSGAAYATVHKLVRDGVLVKLGGGNYQRSDVKALAPPKAEKGEKSEKGKRAK